MDQAALKKQKLAQTIDKAQLWLEESKQTFRAETDTGITFKDNFVSLLILELSKRWDYVDLRIPARRWNYFGGKPVIVPEDYPDDNDTNAVAFSILKPVDSQARLLLDEILQCKNEDGVIQVHLDPNRPREAPEVSANILTLFYTFGRGQEVQPSLHYLQKDLEKPVYEPSRYYFMPEPLFFFVWRLLRVASATSSGPISAADLPDELQPIRDRLITRVKARIGQETQNSLCPAIRLLVCQGLGLQNETDLQALLASQEDDGSFGPGWYVRYGSTGIKIRHGGFACVMVVEALKAYSRGMTGRVYFNAQI